MKKIITLALMLNMVQLSLCVENLKLLHSDSLVSRKCIGFSDRYIWNTSEQNQACDDLNKLYNFFGSEYQIAEWIRRHSENDKKEISDSIENSFKKNEDTLDDNFESKSWEAIDILLPQATEKEKRYEQYRLRNLKKDLARRQRSKALELLK